MIFTERAKQWAAEGRIAAIDEHGVQMSFAELDKKSDSLAVWLREEGSSPVAIWCDKENFALVAMLACIKAGRAYVMMAIFYPEERVRQIIESSGAKLVLALNSAPIGEVDVPVVPLAELEKYAAEGRTPDESWVLKEDDVLYYVYTSGSTNAPKCVEHTLGNAISSAASHRPVYGHLSGGRHISLNVSPYAFVFSQEQMYYLLYEMGITLFGVGRSLSVEYDKFLEVIYRTQPDLFFGTPSLMATFLSNPDFCSENLPDVKMFVFSGEVTPAQIAKKLFERFPKARLFSEFGSSETLLMGTVEMTPELAEQSEIMPAGLPAANTVWRVLDENGQPAATGEIGRLTVYSGAVAIRYHDNPEMSAQVFIDDGYGHGMLTNDTVYLGDNGYYYYSGRLDNVVKIGGYRVSLDETERALMQCPIVRQGAVVPVMVDGKVDSITAFVVLKDDCKPSLKLIAQIKASLKASSLASYMLPKKFVFLDELPKNSNGKLDRRALKDHKA